MEWKLVEGAGSFESEFHELLVLSLGPSLLLRKSHIKTLAARLFSVSNSNQSSSLQIKSPIQLNVNSNMSLFIIPTSASFEQSHPSQGCPLFNDFQPSQSSYSQASDFFDLMRRGNSHSSLSHSQALAADHARLQSQLEAQRRAAIAKARREELERAYVQQLRLVQAQQAQIEAQRRHRQEQEEIQRYQQFVQRQRRLAQEEYLRRVRLQKAQVERQRRLELQRQQQREQLKLKAGSQDPLLLALEELFGEAFFGSSNEVNQTNKGREPVREGKPVEGELEPQKESRSTVSTLDKAQDSDSLSTLSPSLLSASPSSTSHTAPVTISEKVEPTQPESSSSQPQQASRQLVFTHPFPSKEASASIQTDQVSISVDENSGKVEVSGLWNNEQEVTSSPSRPASPTLSQHSSTSSNKRRAHVNDVDEDGNELESEEWDMAVDAVEDEKKVSSSTTTSRTFTLPEGFKAENLKAEIQDDGLKIYVEGQ